MLAFTKFRKDATHGREAVGRQSPGCGWQLAVSGDPIRGFALAERGYQVAMRVEVGGGSKPARLPLLCGIILV